MQTKDEGWEKILHGKGNEKKGGVHISDRIDFKTHCNKKQRQLYNDKRVKSSRRYNIYKCIGTLHRSTKIYKAYINRLKRRI